MCPDFNVSELNHYKFELWMDRRKQIANEEQEQKQVLSILKFRSFASKEQQGFVFVFNHEIPEMIFEDLLFQLFEPIFQDLACPEIYYFSSTDQTLSYSEMIKMKDYIYVHFSQRIKQYQHLEKYPRKLKIGNLDKLAKGLNFEGTNLYIISEKYYLMYGHQFFYKNVEKKIESLPLQLERKQIKYDEYCREIANLRDNYQFIQLKQELEVTMEHVGKNLKQLEAITNRYAIARLTLKEILQASGIRIQGLKDLY